MAGQQTDVASGSIGNDPEQQSPAPPARIDNPVPAH